MINAQVKLNIREIDGLEVTGYKPQILTVHSHATHKGVSGLVVLELPDGKKITVKKEDLEKAIDRCVGL